MERIVVARVESTPWSPILPKMATSEANNADKNANKNHILKSYKL